MTSDGETLAVDGHVIVPRTLVFQLNRIEDSRNRAISARTIGEWKVDDVTAHLVCRRHRTVGVRTNIRFWTIVSPDKFWSKSMPKYLILVCDFIIWLLQLILNSFTFFNFRLGPKRMHSVLPRWRESLLSTSHSLQDSSSLPSFFEIKSGFLWENMMVLSSA